MFSPIVREIKGCHALDQVVDLDLARLELLLAGEGQHLAGQVRTLARRVDRFAQARLAAFSSASQLAFEQLQIADDDGEQIVEIMGEAAGQSGRWLPSSGPAATAWPPACAPLISTTCTISCSIWPSSLRTSDTLVEPCTCCARPRR